MPGVSHQPGDAPPNILTFDRSEESLLTSWKTGDSGIDLTEAMRNQIRDAQSLIIAWTLSGSGTTVADAERHILANYDAAVTFTLPDMAAATATTRSSNSGQRCDNSDYFTMVDVVCIVGECNLPARMYTGTGFNTIEYGRSFGLVLSDGNPQCDWRPDNQDFKAVYIPRTAGPIRGIVAKVIGGSSDQHTATRMTVFTSSGASTLDEHPTSAPDEHPTSAPPAAPSCSTDGTWYLPVDMAGQGRTVGTAAQCQQRCRDTAGCRFFNNFPNGGCHISTGAEGTGAGGNNPTRMSGSVQCSANRGGRFLEMAEGQGAVVGNTAQLLAQINEQQSAGTEKVTRGYLRRHAINPDLLIAASNVDLTRCQLGNADFAVWLRVGIGGTYATHDPNTQASVGLTVSANLGVAFGCDGAGTAFMFPTIDVGIELSGGVGISTSDNLGNAFSLSLDVFANYDGLSRRPNYDGLFQGGTGVQNDGQSSVWGNKLGWGLSAGINVMDWTLGLSFTLPQLEIGTSNVLGLEFPSSASLERPRLAGIGISGPVNIIWSMFCPWCSAAVIAEQVSDAVEIPELSISVGIGFVGIIGGQTANYFQRFGRADSTRPAKGASCNNMLTFLSPSHIFDCGDNVFVALPKSILTHWPFNA
jgi:hypothetical protein